MSAPVVVGVYSRPERRPRVERLLAAGARRGMGDRPRGRSTRSPPELAPATRVGSGPGESWLSSNEAARASWAGRRRWVVLSDDDVEFVRGDLVDARRPRVRRPGSASRSRPTRRARRSATASRASAARSRARLTTFVESGPARRRRARVDRARPAAPGVAGDGLGHRARVDGSSTRRAACSASSTRCRIRAPRHGRRHVRRRPGDPRAHARGARRARASTDLRRAPAHARRPGGRGSAGRRGARPMIRLPPAVGRGRAGEPDAPRRPLVLARRRARDRGAPALPGLPRLRPGASDRARPQRRARRPSSRCARRSSRRSSPSPYTSFGTPGRQPAASAAAGSRATGTTSSTIPPRRDPDRSSASRASAATTRRRAAISARRLAVGVAGRAAARRTRRISGSGSRCPERERERARQELGGRRAIAVMPAGSGARVPVSVDDLLARDPRRARAALPGRRRSRSSAGSTTRAVGRRAGSRAARSTGCSPRADTRSTRSTAPILEQLAARRGVEPLRLAAHGVRVRRASPSTRRGSRSRAATGTSTSSTACRSTRCCPKSRDVPRVRRTAGRCR